ncbi:hypothetical protein JCM21900_004316 [Sporobolomyces salmonicolor]
MACSCECSHEWDEDDDVPGELVYDLKDRPIRPLPKRQRLLDVAHYAVDGHGSTGSVAGSAHQDSESELEADDDLGRRARDVRASLRSQEPALEARTADHLDYGDGRAHYPPRKRTEPPSACGDPGLVDTADSTKSADSLDPSSTTASTESPLTSPASPSFTSFDPQKDSDAAYHSLFGEDGHKIAKTLTTASSFSAAGLFGGLGLASLHPSLGPVAAERHYEEEEDGDEDSYGVVDRSRPPVEPTPASTAAATALGLGGSNKKKRKIPGLNIVSAALPDERRPDDAAEPAGPGAKDKVKSPGLRSDFGSDSVPTKAPVNPPTTAKAALAKLRVRPPHVSLCLSCFSSRRYRRKRFRSTSTKQQPLLLPAAPAFVPPAMPREGPPPLPPGSGLKGSKALKAAMKAAKEREKEKERIKKLFAGVKLPNLFDPAGTGNPPPNQISRLISKELARRRGALSADAPVKCDRLGYPTPPASSDEAEGEPFVLSPSDSTPPELEVFDFVHAPPALVEARWTALNEQKERLKAAKERAAKAREEEKERKREKEEKEKTDKATAAARPPAPPTPAATPERPPASSTARPAAPTPSTADLPPAPPPAAALPSPPVPPPPPPPRKAPPKKGRKKRSAHANAHNVHHRDNYVPSRLPSSSTHHTPQTTDASLGPTTWPASEEALASAGPYASTCGGGHFCSADEWLCLFCEYELFYGEEPALYRAVRKRKNVLKVRKKAQERAQKATQGAGGGGGEKKDEPAPSAEAVAA